MHEKCQINVIFYDISEQASFVVICWLMAVLQMCCQLGSVCLPSGTWKLSFKTAALCNSIYGISFFWLWYSLTIRLRTFRLLLYTSVQDSYTSNFCFNKSLFSSIPTYTYTIIPFYQSHFHWHHDNTTYIV